MRHLISSIEIKFFGIRIMQLDEWREENFMPPQKKTASKFNEIFPEAINSTQGE